jgi:hypothetical protein
LKKLHTAATDFGGQSLLNDTNDHSSQNEILNNTYLVETILMDDIVEVIPSDFHDCIMKIDIEGNENKAFKHASKLFSKLNILAGKKIIIIIIIILIFMIKYLWNGKVIT